MNKPEFLNKLRENKQFDNINDEIEYKIPVIQYHVNHYPANMIINGQIVDFKSITITKPNDENNINLMRYAFEALKRNNLNQ